jgi:hypothetical protein
VRRAALGTLFLAACGQLKLPAAHRNPAIAIQVEPLGELERAPSVLRLRLPGERGRAELADFHVFAGTLSSYHLHRLAARDLPDTLLAREIRVLAWSDGDDLVVAPAQALPEGTFSLATPELGLVAEVTVDASLVPWLERRWPPRASAEGAGFSVFCGEGASGAEPGAVVLEPAGVEAELRAGVGEAGLFADDCVSLEPAAASVHAPELPPALAGAVALEPLPLSPLAAPLTPPTCDGDERALGPACAAIDDDRLVLRAPDEPSLWVIAAPEPLLGVAAPGTSLVVHGLEPGVPRSFAATAFDRNGARTTVDERVTGAARHAHLVINEVLANPRGPESASEWIELVNDGAAAVDLDGLELCDAGGAVSLPATQLAAGEFALLVADGFALDPELDVPLAAGTRVLTLPKLGQAGLANGGELLRLCDASGAVLSRFPALAAPEAGVSMARRSPDAPDEDAGAFGAHAAPGASPGAPNELAPP